MPLASSSDAATKKRTPIDVLPTIGSALQLSVTTSSARQALTSGCNRVSITANGCNMRFLLGDNTVAANASTSHYLANGERIEFTIDTTNQTNIAAIAISGSGTLEITELA